MSATATLSRPASRPSMLSPRGYMQQRTPWKDSERLAEFIANVAGGIFVLTWTATYLLNVHELVSKIEVPSVQNYLRNQALAVCEYIAHVFAEGWEVMQKIESFTFENLTDLRMISKPLAALFLGTFGVLVLHKYKSVGWFCYLQIGVIIQQIVALYQIARIFLSLSAYFTVKTLKVVLFFVKRVYVNVFGVKDKHAEALRRVMKTAKSYAEWTKMAEYLDELQGKEKWKTTILPDDLDHCDFYQLNRNIEVLQRAIEKKSIAELKFIVAPFAMRNKLGIDSPNLHLECNSGTKLVIDKYTMLVIQALDILANATPDEFPTFEKAQFFKQMKQSFGSTALCLSGGGSLAMYHMGVIKALIEADLLPNVVSGSSGGSITAAMLACRTNEELITNILKNDISTRYIPIGIRWFPPLLQQLAHCIKTGFLVDSSIFEQTTQQYYSEPMDSEEKIMYYTFQDAFLKTGRHVCITVSASDVTGHKGPKKLLLNHINSPNVLLWSAVAVSCSLPGIMKGRQLMARDYAGNVVPYISLGKEWMDGSIQHDLPMETMASCFNVTNFIVSQVNPHVVPFVGADIDTPTFRNSLFHTLESVIAADVRHRLKMLAFLGLFPKIYGHQISSYLKQNFSGNVTLIPDFIFLEAIGIKAILNPTVDDMKRYIEGGQQTLWPKLTYIRHLCSIEKRLDKHLEKIDGPHVAAPYKNWLHPNSQTAYFEELHNNATC